MLFVGKLVLLAAVCFIQNMAFTWSSRSRNSGDPNYHRFAAWGSNGIWFICQLFVFSWLWKPLMEGDYVTTLVGGAVYIAATTEGSVYMMKLLLGKVKSKTFGWLVEKDKRSVGAR